MILIFWQNAYGQRYTSYSIEDGLPSNHVYDIKQDEDGYLWFATNCGIAKFDGNEFTTFTAKDGLPNNDVWRLEIGDDNEVWYFSNSRFQGYIKNDSVYRFSSLNNEVLCPKFSFRTKNGFLFSSYKGEICGVQRDEFKTVYEPDNSLGESEWLKEKEDEGYCMVVFPTEEELLYLGFTANEVIVVGRDFKERFRCNIQNFTNADIHKYGRLHNGVLFKISKEGLILIDPEYKKVKCITTEGHLEKNQASEIYCISTPSEIQLSYSGNLIILNYELQVLDWIKIPQQISNIRSFKDQSGNVWTTDLSSGIKMVSYAQLKSKPRFVGEKVEAIGEINDQLIAGVYGLGFYVLDNEKESELEVTRTNSNSKIYAVEGNSNNQRGYLISGAASFELENQVFVPFSVNSKKGKPEERVGFKSIVELGEYKFVSNHFEISQYDTTNSLTNKYLKSGILQLEAYKDRVFIGATDGLFVLNDNRIIPVQQKSSLLTLPINNMCVANEFLFVGTNGRGVYIYHDNGIIHLKNTDDLIIKKICVQQELVWLATNRGVKMVRIDKRYPERSPIINSFYSNDGLTLDNVNDLCIKDGVLFTSTDNGLSQIDPTDPIFREPPDLRFKEKNDTITIRSREDKLISVSFFVLNYVNQKHYKYHYRLHPKHTDWIETNSKTLNFSSLEPNLYALEVKASDQHLNETVRTLYINVLPAWWETFLAKICFVGILIITLTSMFWLILINIRKKEARKSQLKKDMATIQLQALRSQMNPHFVHNSLNAIQYFIQQHNVYESENYLTKFSKLIRLFFDCSQKEYITLREEIEIIRSYLSIENLRFGDKFEYEISVDPLLDADQQLIPTMILQPIVENAVNHGIFHITKNGKIKVNFFFEGSDAFRVLVEDNGVGVKNSEKIKEQSIRNYRSTSSKVLNDRLTLLKENKEWEVVHTMSDLIEDDETPGTKVELYFKQI